MPLARTRPHKLIALTCAALVVTALALAAPASAVRGQRQLLLKSGGLLHAPDPSVLHITKGRDAGWYQYFGGGEHIRATRAPTVAGRYGPQPVMVGPQAWFRSAKGSPDGSHEMWAPSVFPVGKHYVMYFTAWAYQQQRRCMGISVAPRPMGPYHLVTEDPICAPRAADDGARKASAIDPSSYRSASGQRWMIFQAGVANRVHVAIWAFRMQPDGVDFASPKPQVVLRAAPGLGNAIENPKVIRHGARLYLFVSANYWRGCRYRTDVYSARSLDRFSAAQHPIHLLTRANTGLCGPGGASVTLDGSVIVFTAWIPQRGAPPPGQRYAYTGTLRWSRNGPS